MLCYVLRTCWPATGPATAQRGKLSWLRHELIECFCVALRTWSTSGSQRERVSNLTVHPPGCFFTAASCLYNSCLQ
jgi:hypothetical protein